MQDEKKSGGAGFIAGLKSEFKKIVFPTRQEVIKHSVATIVLSVLVGLLITGLDIAMKWGLGLILVKYRWEYGREEHRSPLVCSPYLLRL